MITATRTFDIPEWGSFILMLDQIQVVRKNFDQGWAKIHAIKALRNTDTDKLSLQVSKRIVEQLWAEWTESDRTFELPYRAPVTLTATQIESLKGFHTGNQKIPAIKALRATTGLGLRDSKIIADRLWAEWGPCPVKPVAASDGVKDLMPNKQPQRQDSLAAQLQTVLGLAVRAGCYDAHEFLLRLMEKEVSS